MARLAALLALLLCSAGAAASAPASQAQVDAASASAQLAVTEADAALRSLGALLASADIAALQSNPQPAAASLSYALASLWSGLPAVQSALATLTGAAAVGAWDKTDQGEAIALDIPFGVFAARQAFFSAAFVGAVAYCLNASQDTVTVSSFQQTAAGTAAVFFNVLLDGTDSSSSAVVSNDFLAVQSLFVSADVAGL